MKNVREFVIETILEVCRPERPDLSDHEKSLLAGDVDSLDFATVLMAVEDKYGISMAEVDVEEVSSINKLVRFIESNQKR